MKRILAVGALLALATPASAQSLFPNFFGNNNDPETTRSFRAEALRSDAFEIETSRIALERSRDPRVRAHARRMIQDHSQTTAALLPPNASLNATGNVVPTQEAGLLGGGVTGILSAPFTVPVNFIGDTFAGGSRADANNRVVLDGRRAQAVAQLQQSRGQRQFNATYADQQVKSHQEAVALYANEAQNGSLPEARSFAAQALPTLQVHLDDAVRLDERVGYPSAQSF